MQLLTTRIPLFLLFAFFFTTANAQNYLTIKGKVVDAENKSALAYAHVGIPERGIGTSTSYDGSFTLKVPELYANSTLTVSFMGYETYQQALNKVNNPASIQLKPDAKQLQTILVLDEKSVEDIIRKAVREIPNNYPTKKTSMTGFYRESKTLDSKDYSYLAEGVLSINKTSYKSDNEGQVGLVQGRQIVLDPTLPAEELMDFSSGHLAAHRFDFVKHREDFIREENFEAYQYWLEGITSYDNQAVYIIGFDQQDGHPNGRMKGKMYIDTLSYAFIRAEFEITPTGLQKRSDYPLYVGRWEGNTYKVTYRKTGNKWQFSSAIREGFWRDGGVYSNEILITEIQDKYRAVPYLERLDRGDPFLRMTGEYDENFWQNYNTTPLSSGLEESVRHMQTQRKAAEVFDQAFMENLQRQRDSIRQERLIEQMREEADSSMVLKNDVETLFGSKQKPKKKKFRVSMQFQPGVGVHLLETTPATLGITYFDEESGLEAISASGQLPNRQFEILAQIEGNIMFGKNLFLHWGFSGDFYNHIYRERSIGPGIQLNLAKQRPFMIKAMAQYSNLNYGAKVGQAENDFGRFRADGKRYKADRINMYYGATSHNLETSVELALEIHPGLELFARGTYFYPFAQNEKIWLWERRELFRKKDSMPIDNNILIESDDLISPENIFGFESYLFTIGVVYK
jgi:hypothetical protein